MAYESNDNMVSHPNHYQSGKYEVIDVIEEFTKDLEGIEAVDTANAIKYILRWKKKNGKQDIEKAIWYLTHLKEHLENEDVRKCETCKHELKMSFEEPCKDCIDGGPGLPNWEPEEDHNFCGIECSECPCVDCLFKNYTYAVGGWRREEKEEKEEAEEEKKEQPEVDKYCFNCIHSSKKDSEYPCIGCYKHSKWEHVDYDKEKKCCNCKYELLDSTVQPCKNCLFTKDHLNFEPKNEESSVYSIIKAIDQLANWLGDDDERFCLKCQYSGKTGHEEPCRTCLSKPGKLCFKSDVE